ncbi:hypothetical protein K7G98_40635, partial [Saccharothrix sp. MB29]|nr:hypothetical protein [Saccharothrix sp. MB29]
HKAPLFRPVQVRRSVHLALDHQELSLTEVVALHDLDAADSLFPTGGRNLGGEDADTTRTGA